jgi:hypothetical protein
MQHLTIAIAANPLNSTVAKNPAAPCPVSQAEAKRLIRLLSLTDHTKTGKSRFKNKVFLSNTPLKIAVFFQP